MPPYFPPIVITIHFKKLGSLITHDVCPFTMNAEKKIYFVKRDVIFRLKFLNEDFPSSVGEATL